MGEIGTIKDKMEKQDIYGLMAEFATPEELKQAAQRTYAAGYRETDAYSPFPVEGVDEALGQHHTRLPLLVLLGGIFGGCGGYFMMYYAAVISYPLNVGGRPLNSWPAFIPITFELTVLCAALATVIGMLTLNGLPTPYHPVFNVERFALASRDRFFLCIKARDPHFDLLKTREFLQTMDPYEVSEVEV